jgi:hypothetical protein
LRNWLFLFLSENPTLKALEVDKSYRSLALASQDKRVIYFVLLITPTDSALNVLWGFIVNVLQSLHPHSLFQFLLVKFILRHLLLITSEVLHSEPDSSQFNGIKFLNLVVVFAVFIFEGSGN